MRKTVLCPYFRQEFDRIEGWCEENGFDLGKSVDALSQAEMKEFVEEHNIPCPSCATILITLII